MALPGELGMNRMKRGVRAMTQLEYADRQRIMVVVAKERPSMYLLSFFGQFRYFSTAARVARRLNK